MRRWLVLLLGTLMVTGAVACGAGEDGKETSAATAAATSRAADAPVPTTVATAQALATPATPRLPVTVTDRDGRRVTVTDVSRVIPLNGDIAEVVWALGLGQNVVATDTSATYPEDAAKLPKIGYQRSLSSEGILSLKPTLVLGNENAGPPPVIEQIRAAGVPVVIAPATTTLEGVPVKIRAIAEALGVAPRGEALAQQTRNEIEAAKALAARATSKSPKVAFLYVRGAGTQQIGGKGTSADALIMAAGGVDAGVAAGITGFQPITAEALVTAQPDILLLLSAGLESVGGVDGLLIVAGVAQTPAGRNRRVLHYDDQYLLGMGPRTGQALRDLVIGLHPELR